MPYKEKEIVKVQFTTGEVARRIKVSIPTIHAWCKEFRIVSSVRKRGPHYDKRFGQKQLRMFAYIKTLVDSGLYSRAGMKEKLATFINERPSLRPKAKAKSTRQR